MQAYPHLFQPLPLRHKNLRNRVVFGAHTTNMARGGLPGAAHAAYYLERALGGAAMIVVEPMPVHASAVLTRGNFLHSSDVVIPHFRKLVEPCQKAGAVMIQQLYHVGAHGDQDNSWHAAWSPSGGPSYHDSDGSHAMSEAEIEEVIEGFVQAARRCQQAGFDGVEVWAAYHCLLDQFWTPFSNTRDDKWGGSLENRTRFSREILSRIRRACGEDFIIGLAVNDEPGVEVALSRESMKDIVALHDAQGLMDYVTVGSGSYFDFSRLIPSFQEAEMLGADLAEVLKPVTRKALVIAESHVRTPDNANTLLGAGQADLVSIVRGQIADPHLTNKAAEDRSADIRGCLSCNQQCWGRRGRDYSISCLVNPSVGREADWGGDRFSPATAPKQVLVVGGGPAGLEAARVAAERGHRVTLAEASPVLGGQFRLAGLQPRRAQITDLIDWYERQLDQLGVEVMFNSYMDAEDIQAQGADEVVLATGSLPPETGFQKALPHLSELPGLAHGHVWSAEDVLSNRAKLGNHVVVLDEGGNWRGCGTAWYLAEAGYQVTLVTPDALVGKELQRSSTDFALRKALATAGVRFITDAVIAHWGGQGAEVLSLLTGVRDQIMASDLVMATVNQAEMSLRDELLSLGVAPQLIGDANAPRLAAQAVHEGRACALSL
ncbi:FAD-dependent oxidoreductase [Pseudophaeobacter sp. EL27]|uniref:oxidoreductase n=1 Tax=Pseudophaeobacter sp. EL27 TaxID=2107580 RepID=UPI000EFBB49E|nr:FAD-dependent oxidoreductase [Pseudophaeobacter sp. EL27]